MVPPQPSASFFSPASLKSEWQMNTREGPTHVNRMGILDSSSFSPQPLPDLPKSQSYLKCATRLPRGPVHGTDGSAYLFIASCSVWGTFACSFQQSHSPTFPRVALSYRSSRLHVVLWYTEMFQKKTQLCSADILLVRPRDGCRARDGPQVL